MAVTYISLAINCFCIKFQSNYCFRSQIPLTIFLLNLFCVHNFILKTMPMLILVVIFTVCSLNLLISSHCFKIYNHSIVNSNPLPNLRKIYINSRSHICFPGNLAGFVKSHGHYNRIKGFEK